MEPVDNEKRIKLAFNDFMSEKNIDDFEEAITNTTELMYSYFKQAILANLPKQQ
jgi:hypothetical protein